MKKKLYLGFQILCILTILSCNKEDEIKETSVIQTGYEGQFHRDIAVSDDSGENTVYFAVSSDDECQLDAYLASTSFSIQVGSFEINSPNLKGSSIRTELNDSILQYYSLDQEPKIFVQKMYQNLKPDVKSFQLKMYQNKLKEATFCGDFLYGYPVGYSGDHWDQFLGIIWWEWGYELVAKLQYKENWYSLSWKDFATVVLGYCDYDWVKMEFSSYKKSIVVYPHHNQNGINYLIAYAREEFRGTNCTIGSWDGAHCYVGTPPAGTTAFMYPNNTGNFYYSPVHSVIPCPYPGSHYDGANCWVMDIPASNPGFIYNNKWYAQPDLLLK
jgi:hypothetical protein